MLVRWASGNFSLTRTVSTRWKSRIYLNITQSDLNNNMLEYSSVLELAAQSFITNPSPTAIIQALLTAEKTAKKNKKSYSLQHLQGTWRLGFITGTKKKPNSRGIILGSGRYIPNWVIIQLSYSSQSISEGCDSIVAIVSGLAV